MSVIIWLWGLFGNIRNDFIPVADQKKWQLPYLFPQISWHWIVITFLLLTLIAILEGSYRVHAQTITSIQTRHEHMQQLRDTGDSLSKLYVDGLALKRDVIGSDDTLTVEECRERLTAWSDELFESLSRKVSVAKAQYVVNIERVQGATIGGMKSVETRKEKNDLLLYHTERLRRLGETLRDY